MTDQSSDTLPDPEETPDDVTPSDATPPDAGEAARAQRELDGEDYGADYPVPFIGKHDEPARHVLALQRREERQSLGVRHAIVQLSSDHQGRRFEILRIEMR